MTVYEIEGRQFRQTKTGRWEGRRLLYRTDPTKKKWSRWTPASAPIDIIDADNIRTFWGVAQRINQ